jgi:hypothetical protein
MKHSTRFSVGFLMERELLVRCFEVDARSFENWFDTFPSWMNCGAQLFT